jgi:hypothetical protein
MASAAASSTNKESRVETLRTKRVRMSRFTSMKIMRPRRIVDVCCDGESR